MRISRRGLKRALRRTAEWVWPREARRAFRFRGWAAVSILAALFVQAESSAACVTVDPGRFPTVEQHAWMASLSADRSADAVHASTRSIGRYRGSAVPARRSAYRTASRTPVEMDPAILPAVPPAAADLSTPAATQAVKAIPEGDSRAILQGEFAVLMLKTLRLRAPQGGWLPGRAINVLAGLRLQTQHAGGVSPPGGWREQQPLTEGDLAFLLQQLGLDVIARNPGRVISVEEAEAVLAKLSALFRELAPAAFTAPPQPARRPLGNPARPPLSPSAP